MKVLETRPEQVIFLNDDGMVVTEPNDSYFDLKLKHNQGRINYIFDTDMYVMETFDSRIFNAWCHGMRFTIRSDLAVALCKIIKDNMKGAKEISCAHFEDLFQGAMKEYIYHDILDLFFVKVAHLEKMDDGYVMHGILKVDWHGNAYVKVKGQWSTLCIVMKGTNHSYEAEAGHLPTREGGTVKVNSLTMTIVSKVMFFLDADAVLKAVGSYMGKELTMKLKQIRGGE